MLDQHIDSVLKALSAKTCLDGDRILGICKDCRDDFLWVVFIQDSTSGSLTPYIVWSFNEQTDGLFQGAYCRSAADGFAEFDKRCASACKGNIHPSLEGGSKV